MKKLLVIVLALVTIQISAQEKRGEKVRKADLTPQEMAQLQTKKMTLDLDLTEAQQKQVGVINLENAKARKGKMEARKNSEERPSKEEMLKMKNGRLDAQIANKKKMKSILNAAQYEKWEKQKGKRNAMEGKRKMKKREHGEDQERKHRN